MQSANIENPKTSATHEKKHKLILSEPPSSAPDLLFANAPEKKLYWDRSHYDSPATQILALTKSKALYIGNLAFSTTSQHLFALFSSVGHVSDVHLGLDRYKKTPCGFAFVEYTEREHALEAVACLSGSKLDGRVIRVELDAGFKPGRQYGRGVSGGQVRDERRTTIDPARSSTSGGTAAARTPVKWEAPQKKQCYENSPSSGANSQTPRPYPSTAAADLNATGKREREEDEDEPMQQAKNPRFREDGSDDEM